MRKFFCIFVFSFLSFSAKASSLGWILSLGAEMGGDSIGGYQYTDGSSSSISFGEGVFVSAGGIVNIFDYKGSNVDLQSTLGIKYASTKKSTNAELSWQRVPIEVLAFYRSEYLPFRIGGGFLYHVNNRISMEFSPLKYRNGKQEIFKDSMEFHPSKGAVFELGYISNSSEIQVLVSLRYTIISYFFENQISKNSGDSIGLSFSFASF